MKIRIEAALSIIRETVPDWKRRYTQGYCFKVYELIKAIDPNAEPFYCQVEGHVWTYAQGYYWDINGISRELPKGLMWLKSEPNIYNQASKWKYQGD